MDLKLEEVQTESKNVTEENELENQSDLRKFSFDNNSSIMLTADGQNFFKDKSKEEKVAVLEAIRSFRDQSDKIYEKNKIGFSIFSKLIASRKEKEEREGDVIGNPGRHGKVFKIDDLPIVIKEFGSTKSMKKEKNRLQLQDVIENQKRIEKALPEIQKSGYIPDCGKLPVYYGGSVIPHDEGSHPERQYLIMEKIDNGISVRDVIKEKDNAKSFFGDKTPDEIKKIKTMIKRGAARIKTGVKKYYEDKADVSPFRDLGDCNILLEKNPESEYGFDFYIIDQES